MWAKTPMSLRERQAWALWISRSMFWAEGSASERPQDNGLTPILSPVQLPSETECEDRAYSLFISCPHCAQHKTLVQIFINVFHQVMDSLLFLVCSKCLSQMGLECFAPMETSIWLFFFSLLIWWITLIVLLMLNQPCIPGICPSWSWGH